QGVEQFPWQQLAAGLARGLGLDLAQRALAVEELDAGELQEGEALGPVAEAVLVPDEDVARIVLVLGRGQAASQARAIQSRGHNSVSGRVRGANASCPH